MKHMPHLDALRGFAILGVLYVHWVPGCPEIGAMGVPLFFVLSGFLITGILLRLKDQIISGEHTTLSAFRHFYYRRTLRIFPLYYLVLALGCLLGLAGFREYWPWHVAYLTNFPVAANSVMASHFWSLACEEQFYLIWPFIVFGCSQRMMKVVVAFMLGYAVLYRNIILATDYDLMELRLLPAVMDYLAAGSALAMMHKNNSMPSWVERMFRWDWLVAMGIVLIVVSPSGYNIYSPSAMPNIGSLPQFDLYRFLPCILFAGLVHRCAVVREQHERSIMDARWLQYLGKISYGVYILHQPIRGILAWMWPAFWEYPWGSIPVSLVATLSVAALSYHFFESPINALKDRAFGRRSVALGAVES